jgi:tetratricopeptide (TPR) repeat protein
MSFIQLVRVAINHENNKDYTRAFNAYNQSLSYTGNENSIIKIRSRQAWCLHLVGNPQETEKIYQELIENHESNPWSHILFAKYLIKTRRQKQAKNLLQKSSLRFPDNLELYLLLASLLKDMERSNEAIQVLKKALTREDLTRGRGILRKDIWAELGTLFYIRGDYNSAISALKKSLRMDLDENFLHYDVLSACYLKVGDPENVLYYVDKYIRYNGDMDAELLILKARSHCRLKQYPHASASLLQAYAFEDGLSLTAEEMVDLAPLKQFGFLETLENLSIEE